MPSVIPEDDPERTEDVSDSLPLPSGDKRIKSSSDAAAGTVYIVNRKADEPDWYGNLPLHHICAQVDHITEIPKNRITEFMAILSAYPQAVRMHNQFGRLPLHYALDRSKPQYKIVRALLERYPEGVSEVGEDNMTAYDLSVKWKHPNRIQRLILGADPSLDWQRYISLTYGPIIGFFCNIFRSDPNPKPPISTAPSADDYEQDDITGSFDATLATRVLSSIDERDGAPIPATSSSADAGNDPSRYYQVETIRRSRYSISSGDDPANSTDDVDDVAKGRKNVYAKSFDSHAEENHPKQSVEIVEPDHPSDPSTILSSPSSVLSS